MTTQEVIERIGCSHAAAAHWAAANGVKRVPTGAILAYNWTEADIARFAQRPHAGRPKKK